MPCYFKAQPAGNMFICGDLGEHCADCSWVADFLCDYPVGDDKTCSRPICEEHAHEVAPGVHYCSGHLAKWQEFRAAGGVERELANVVPFAAPKSTPPNPQGE
jgi:hypothetical protein